MAERCQSSRGRGCERKRAGEGRRHPHSPLSIRSRSRRADAAAGDAGSAAISACQSPRAGAVAFQQADDAAFEQRLGMPRFERERLVEIGGGRIQRLVLAQRARPEDVGAGRLGIDGDRLVEIGDRLAEAALAGERPRLQHQQGGVARRQLEGFRRRGLRPVRHVRREPGVRRLPEQRRAQIGLSREPSRASASSISPASANRPSARSAAAAQCRAASPPPCLRHSSAVRDA